MNTFIAAGVHEGLVPLTGRIAAHPDGKNGLVMELVPERFYNLGMPPSLESCTRDVFKNDASMSLRQVLKIAGTIASVAEQLHARGIMHGDLYAHNTLVDDEGNTLFGDFGAASFYDKSDSKVAAALERLEVRAFGYLLDDLFALCTDTDENATIIKLKTLRDACVATSVLSRPDFPYLNDELMKLQDTGL